MKRKKQAGYPPYYRRNVARQTERRYLSDGMTRTERVKKRKEEIEKIFYRCICETLKKESDVWPEDIIRLSRCADQLLRWYGDAKEVQGAGAAKLLLAERAKEIMPERFLLPPDRAVKGTRDLVELTEIREAAEIDAWIYAIAIHNTLGYDQKKVKEIFEAAKEEYRQEGSGD